jgi:hypothetical protein
VLTAPGAAARAPRLIAPTATVPNVAASGSTCYVGTPTCSEVPCVYMITGGQGAAMSALPQLALAARSVRSRCTRPQRPGNATIVERPKTAMQVSPSPGYGSLLPPGAFRGSLARRIAVLSHAVMHSLGARSTP